ncbi:MAG: hypothetical protein JSS29_19450 [Proteobacteria bacterium]|nr:hypothetical protein [Pseudomonadota bacterium]
MLRKGSDPPDVARKLAQKYHFTVMSVWSHAILGFVIRNIDLHLIPVLQCEPDIEQLSFDAVTMIT